MIEEIINQYKNKSFLVAYSGGLDSTVLLHKLIQIKKKIPHIRIRTIHINHNFTVLSKKWTEHCIKICNSYKIPIVIENIHISNSTGNIEEKFRIKRYNIIYNHLLFDEILLTGHHMNDQCETFFLSLKRGSGPTGLSSMSFETLFGNKKIVRPLLTKTKKELELFARHEKLNWIEDFSNLNINYDRNFIRHKIIPVLEKKWPFFLKNCFRTINICKKETIILNYLLDEKIHTFIDSNYSLNITNFKMVKKEICIALIRYWLLLKKIKMPSYKQMQSIYSQMILSKIDAQPKVILHNHEIRRYKQLLYLIQKKIDIKGTVLFWNQRNKDLILPNNLGILTENNKGIILPEPQVGELINIRFQYEGKILILGRKKARKIKKIWQEQKIPPWLRDQIPLLFYNDDLISALGVFVINRKNNTKNTWSISWSNHLKSIDSNSLLFY